MKSRLPMLLLMRILQCLSLILVAIATANQVNAGIMTHDAMSKHFPAPYIIGEKEKEMPVWPIFKKNMTSTDLVAYAFESIDFAPVPGFSGVPMNLLIALDTKGTFLDVQVLSHHEPVFLDGLGEAPMRAFVHQYNNLSLKQNIKITTHGMSASRQEGANVYLDGVSKATASVRIINQSALSSALKVARKKLGFAEGRDPDLIARIKSDSADNIPVSDLYQRGLIQTVTMNNKEIEKLFQGSEGAGLDPIALRTPEANFIDMELSYVSVPAIGRSLLGEKGWASLQNRLEPGDHALMFLSRGRYGVVGDDFTRGAVPDRLMLKQGDLPIEIRDLDLDIKLPGIGTKPATSANSITPTIPTAVPTIKIFRIISQSGLDPSQKLEFFLHVTRNKGIIYPEKITRDVSFSMQLPSEFYIAAESDNKSWHSIWKQRWWELTLLSVALIVLSVAMTMQKKLSQHETAFIWFRRSFLLFTLCFIGWYAQGQLSIVNLTSVVQALMAGRDLGFLLYDPMSVSLWIFVLISLIIWGRGTFCGWLCPFGALQEFTGKLAQYFHVPQIRIRAALDNKLKRLKYVLLGFIIISSFVSTGLTDQLIEIEPFKTAITLNFIRSWPFVLYAAGLLLASAVVYKFFCRYLCPFGAGLAVLGRFRILDWLPRRAACGTPCQTCRHHCEYKAIRPDGGIQYDECFQCLDCVVIYESDEKCAPLIMEKKRTRTIPIAASH
ncbi:4Fe-4S binding protein [Undibacterium sp. SXout7W]|uniref:4Fe-4S binding protein n=1 Tax=Undibacterium sp. SXout7W TaxID=3413049 RepID=UPI003BF203D2